jgi:hypothetical protein
MILCGVFGNELRQFSPRGVAKMLFCSRCANNYRKLLANGQGLRLDAVQFGRAMKEARGEFGKTTQIVNKMLMEREIAA